MSCQTSLTSILIFFDWLFPVILEYTQAHVVKLVHGGVTDDLMSPQICTQPLFQCL